MAHTRYFYPTKVAGYEVDGTVYDSEKEAEAVASDILEVDVDRDWVHVNRVETHMVVVR